MPCSWSHRGRVVGLCLLAGALSVGCQASNPAGLVPPDDQRTDSAQMQGPEQVIGTWTLRVDPLHAEATLEPAHSGATASTFLLALDAVVPPRTIRLESVAKTDGQLQITYLVTHPFGGPDITKPPSAGNRADLGFAGRCVFGVDVLPDSEAPTSYFGGDVVLEPALVTNADGYLQSGALIPFAGKTANTFPYQVLVDESGEGNRVDLTNSGKTTGNYQAIVGGWQRYNMGSGGTVRWTGYGFLHQGQAARRTLSLDLERLADANGPIDIAVHLLAKYIDPRGGADVEAKIANRIPGSIANEDKFLYRLPFAALDVERVRVVQGGNGLLPNDPDSSGTIVVKVVDWDARATESEASNLADDDDPSTIPAGTAGVPLLKLEVPGVLNSAASLSVLDDDTAYGGDTKADTGILGDELTYSTTITNQQGGNGNQTTAYYTGLLRATDPEATLDRSAWELPLTPELTPLPSNALAPVVYQVVRVPVGDFGVADCPTAPFNATKITKPPTFASSVQVNAAPETFYTSFGPLDFAAWRTTDYSGVLLQGYHDGTGEITTENYDIWSFAPGSGQLVRVTNLGQTFRGAQISNLETDRTNRLLFTQLDGATLFSDVNLTYAYARGNIGYLDYSGSPITAAPRHINTGANRMVAVTVDAENNVYGIDHNNRLHFYKRTPGSYQEQVDSLRDLPSVFGMADPFWICDFAIDFYNDAFFFLVKPDDGGENDAFVYRMECDGTVRASIAGHPNPLTVQVYEYGGSLSIDNHASNGSLLNGAQDAQIVVGGYSDPVDLYLITSELEISAELFSENGAMEFQPEYCGTQAVARLEVAGHETLDIYTLPAAWQ